MRCLLKLLPVHLVASATHDFDHLPAQRGQRAQIGICIVVLWTVMERGAGQLVKDLWGVPRLLKDADPLYPVCLRAFALAKLGKCGVYNRLIGCPLCVR